MREPQNLLLFEAEQAQKKTGKCDSQISVGCCVRWSNFRWILSWLSKSGDRVLATTVSVSYGQKTTSYCSKMTTQLKEAGDSSLHARHGNGNTVGITSERLGFLSRSHNRWIVLRCLLVFSLRFRTWNKHHRSHFLSRSPSLKLPWPRRGWGSRPDCTGWGTHDRC